ncbi:MAG: 16S rRNA (guanine(966)-N(2))-methyltransferase RsmD [Candidatus Kaelpia aquatica]|nr:16S rRNA (guanine(966)-N(2))-methyltransferase RsmD [Candidatus Kaelpia aquatica]
MQVISGRFKGLRVYAPLKSKISPTSSVVKRSIFDSLRDDVKNKVVLDLYAGSGALGIEALSRGGREAVFVENNLDSLGAIRKNIKPLNGVKTEVIAMDAAMAIRFLRGRKFDIIFIDPPYREKVIKSILLEISECDIVRKNSLVFTEHHKKEVVSSDIGVFRLVREKKYGDTVVSIFTNSVL